MNLKEMKQLVLSLVIIIPFFSLSQSGRLKYANKQYEQKSYYYASEAYEDVIDRKTDSSVVAVRISDSYDKIGNTKKAAEWYRFIQRKGQLTREQHLRLALLERQLENYDGSSQLLASYEQRYGGQDVVKSILGTDASIDVLRENKGQFELKLQEKVNTENSEIGTSFYSSDEVILASAKRRSKAIMRVHSWTGNYFYDIYRAPVGEDGQIGKMKLVKSQIKSKFHDGPAVYNEKTGYIYFTRNNFLGGKKGMDDNRVIRLKLYRAKLEGNKFKDIEELGINDDNYSNAHPSVSKDGKRLYFSSDRPGGYGGMDIFYVNLGEDGKQVGEPVNMGSEINTTQNELFPYYNDQENILFFSSEGHFGLGGLDVFVAKLDKSGAIRKIENLGTPVNSPYDDFSFVNDTDQTKGYFSSNREGGKGDDDVYGFSQKSAIRNSAVLKGNAIDLLAGSKLGNVVIYLADKDGKLIDSIATSKDGSFELSLKNVDGDFQLLGKKEEYLDGLKKITFDPDKMDYNEDVDLMPVIQYYFVGTITDKASGSPLDGVKITIDDTRLNKTFETKVTAGGGFKTGYLPYSYQDKITYNFKLEKEGYLTKTVALSDLLQKESEIRVDGKINLTMAPGEGTNLGELLSLNPIYFDLDKSTIRPDAALELDKVVQIMKDNPKMKIELSSHTDTRASDSYNMALSERRAKSTANYIISHGISKGRIKAKGYGETRLVITDAEIEKASTLEAKEALHQKNRRTEFIVITIK